MALTWEERFLANTSTATHQEEPYAFLPRFGGYIQFVFSPPREAFRIDTKDLYEWFGCETPEELSTLAATHLEEGKHYVLRYRGCRTRLANPKPNGPP